MLPPVEHIIGTVVLCCSCGLGSIAVAPRYRRAMHYCFACGRKLEDDP